MFEWAIDSWNDGSALIILFKLDSHPEKAASNYKISINYAL